MTTLEFIHTDPVVGWFVLERTDRRATPARFTIRHNPHLGYSVQGQWLERSGTWGPTWGIERSGRGGLLPNHRRTLKGARQAAERWYRS